MLELQLGVVEGKFADIIWSNEPVSTVELAKLFKSCAEHTDGAAKYSL